MMDIHRERVPNPVTKQYPWDWFQAASSGHPVLTAGTCTACNFMATIFIIAWFATSEVLPMQTCQG
jgi:hypothetical protein